MLKGWSKPKATLVASKCHYLIGEIHYDADGNKYEIEDIEVAVCAIPFLEEFFSGMKGFLSDYKKQIEDSTSYIVTLRSKLLLNETEESGNCVPTVWRHDLIDYLFDTHRADQIDELLSL
jgi:hypothetical protein